MTKTDALLQRFRDLNVWRRGDERAPHKPLLVLYALGRLQAGADWLIAFDELERPLESLLEEFGPPRKSQHPELRFYHLQTDGVWEIDERVPLTRRQGSQNFLRTELRKWHIAGRGARGTRPKRSQSLHRDALSLRTRPGPLCASNLAHPPGCCFRLKPQCSRF